MTPLNPARLTAVKSPMLYGVCMTQTTASGALPPSERRISLVYADQSLGTEVAGTVYLAYVTW